ncbi:ribosome-associated inhibitor A, partial [Xanthomonas citri pv. citri]|nr:ribosome-associated inhibitor A [Xanthomonas citri pv. citri]
ETQLNKLVHKNEARRTDSTLKNV